MGEAATWEPGRSWFVWTKYGRAPQFAHQTEDSARAEAERLARKYPGQKFHVMQGIAKVHVPVVQAAPVEAAPVVETANA